MVGERLQGVAQRSGRRFRDEAFQVAALFTRRGDAERRYARRDCEAGGGDAEQAIHEAARRSQLPTDVSVGRRRDRPQTEQVQVLAGVPPVRSNPAEKVELRPRRDAVVASHPLRPADRAVGVRAVGARQPARHLGAREPARLGEQFGLAHLARRVVDAVHARAGAPGVD